MSAAEPGPSDAPFAYRLTVAYLGTRYAGWQRQPRAVTVQEVLERALGRLTGEAVRVLGAGRTDAGVHARGQVAALRLARGWASGALVHGTNRHLSADVRVLAAEAVPRDFHPQRDALGKEYRYRLMAVPVLSPLDAVTAVRVAPGTDLQAMRRATRSLVGRHDFTAFAKTGGSHGDPTRTVLAVAWESSGAEWTLRILGDGFLRGMVRGIVGTLLEVGRGRRDPEQIPWLLEGRDRSEAGPNAPAEGLVLQQVFYSPQVLAAARDGLRALW